MKFVQDDNFNEYVEKYKNLPLKEKKELVEKEMEELLVVLNALNEKFGDTPEVLFNREILDLKKEEATEADFVEAMFVYSYSIKELIASLVNGLEK
jgi:hypothetical protein